MITLNTNDCSNMLNLILDFYNYFTKDLPKFIISQKGLLFDFKYKTQKYKNCIITVNNNPSCTIIDFLSTPKYFIVHDFYNFYVCKNLIEIIKKEYNLKTIDSTNYIDMKINKNFNYKIEFEESSIFEIHIKSSDVNAVEIYNALKYSTFSFLLNGYEIIFESSTFHKKDNVYIVYFKISQNKNTFYIIESYLDVISNHNKLFEKNNFIDLKTEIKNSEFKKDNRIIFIEELIKQKIVFINKLVFCYDVKIYNNE